jgi:acylphosphatase
MSNAVGKIAKKFLVAGRVQGVGYRYFAERCADQLGLSGYIKNLGDGSVEVYAIGNAVSLEKFRGSLSQGPPSARVTKVETFDEPVSPRYTRFVIEDGW